MQLTVGGLGAFPNRLRPRVVWVGVKAPQTLLDLQHGIDRETSRLGYPNEDREFSPHLTLGRVSQHATPQEVKSYLEAFGAVQVEELGTVSVQQIWLYKSDLQTGGAVYTPLFKAPLAATKETHPAGCSSLLRPKSKLPVASTNLPGSLGVAVRKAAFWGKKVRTHLLTPKCGTYHANSQRTI